MYFSEVYRCVDIASCSSATGRQTTLRWQKQVFIHTRLSRAYLALARLSCIYLGGQYPIIHLRQSSTLQCALHLCHRSCLLCNKSGRIDTSLSTKIRVYEILVLPVLLYACETWTVLAADERRLETFHMKCQRQISTIRWQDHIRNSEVSAHTGLSPVSDIIKMPSEFCLQSRRQAFRRYAITASTPLSC